MKNIGATLKILRENNGLTRREVSKKLVEYGFDISDKTIYGYESGRSSANADMFLALCKIYKCTDILNTFGDSSSDVLFTNSEWKLLEKYRSLDPFGQETVDIILNREVDRIKQFKEASSQIESTTNSNLNMALRVLQYYQRSASAGTGQVVFDDIPVDRIQIPDIPEYKRVSYAIGVNGHSMEPLYEDGDILLVEPTCQIEIGEIGIFIVGNEAFVKELGEGELISLNKGYKNIPLTEDSKCMGRVVDKMRID